MTKITTPPANTLLPPGLTELFETFQYVDHRGLPLVYPESTTEAYRLSVAAGAKFVEVDCRLLMDGALAVSHDATIDRLTSSSGNVVDYSSATWQRLVVDASSFLGGGWSDTTPPMVEDVVREFGNRVPLILEAKSTGSGAAIIALLEKYNISRDHVLINSATSGELTAAIAAGWKTCLNIDPYSGSPTPAALLATGYWAVAVPAATTSTANMDALRAVGLKVIAFTVNSHFSASAVIDHCDGIYTDDAIYLRGTARRTTDPFGTQAWYHGHQRNLNSTGDRGAFYTPNYWGVDSSAANAFRGSLMGWANPIGGAETASSVTIDFTVKFESAFGGDATRLAWVALMTNDKPFNSDSAGADRAGYVFGMRKNGTLGIDKYFDNNGTWTQTTNIATTAGTAIADGEEATFRITVTPTDLTLERVDVAHSCTVADSTNRGAYLHAGCKGIFGKFKGFALTGISA